jgi:hypothetical protein
MVYEVYVRFPTYFKFNHFFLFKILDLVLDKEVSKEVGGGGKEGGTHQEELPLWRL